MLCISSRMMEAVCKFRHKPDIANWSAESEDDNLSLFRKVVSQPLFVVTAIYAVIEVAVRIVTAILLVISLPFTRNPMQRAFAGIISTATCISWSFQSILTNFTFGEIPATENDWKRS